MGLPTWLSISEVAMHTLLKSKSKEVRINTDGPVAIIGESINPTRRKKLTASLLSGDMSYIFELAKSQIEAGADILDVNVGAPGVDEVEVLPRGGPGGQRKLRRADLPGFVQP